MEKVRKVVRHGLEMREVYDFSKLKMASWFPRHMNKGMIQMQSKMHSVDCVIEVHDIRIPFTGRNSNLTDLGIVRPSVLVMNKVDLIDPQHLDTIRKRLFEETGEEVIFNNCKVSGHAGLKQILPKIIAKIEKSDRYSRSSKKDYNVLTVGIPNVGKSSLVNAMRNHHLNSKKATLVGATPGVTKSVLNRIKVHAKPDIFLLDTPGVLNPRIDNPATALKLGISNTIQQDVINKDYLADYLLYHMNRYGQHKYVEVLELSAPTDNVLNLLQHIAMKYNLLMKVNLNNAKLVRPNWNYCADKFLTMWRKGEFGCAMLDMQNIAYYNRKQKYPTLSNL